MCTDFSPKMRSDSLQSYYNSMVTHLMSKRNVALPISDDDEYSYNLRFTNVLVSLGALTERTIEDTNDEDISVEEVMRMVEDYTEKMKNLVTNFK